MTNDAQPKPERSEGLSRKSGTCERCGGSGKIQPPKGSMFPIVADCPDCHGTGVQPPTLASARCSSCDEFFADPPKPGCRSALHGNRHLPACPTPVEQPRRSSNYGDLSDAEIWRRYGNTDGPTPPEDTTGEGGAGTDEGKGPAPTAPALGEGHECDDPIWQAFGRGYNAGYKAGKADA